MISGWISHFVLGEVNLWFIAPMGASAVLLFGVPNSPLAQPWSIVGGNISLPIDAVSITRADLHEALMQGELFDIDEDDLQEILLRAEQLAHQRQNLN
ncbi:hypothetical protein SPRA44_670029 [Serratia proteamaculans]|nr:hypothetical protein SPRA44_670029 [Serratia proteamaculans]